MPTSSLASFQTYFADIEDPRVERTRRHELLDIILIAICAVICSSDTWVDVEEWGNSKLAWLREYVPLPHGIPSHDTFGAVFGRLKPEQFETSFLRWVQAVMGATGGKVVAIDGTLRGCAARTTGGWVRVPSTWSAPGPVATTCCWARSRWTRNLTKLRLFQHFRKCWPWAEPS